MEVYETWKVLIRRDEANIKEVESTIKSRHKTQD